MVDDLTHVEYDHQHYLGVAGPASMLDPDTLTHWRKQYRDWRGQYWAYARVDTDTEVEPHALRVRPVNLTRGDKNKP